MGFDYFSRQIVWMEFAHNALPDTQPAPQGLPLGYSNTYLDLIHRAHNIMTEHNLRDNHEPFTGHPMNAAGHGLNPNILMPMQAIVNELRTLANVMLANQDQEPAFRDIGTSSRLIASNIQNGLHQFCLLRYLPGQWPPTRDYPRGPLNALARCANELETDTNSLYINWFRNSAYSDAVKNWLLAVCQGSSELIRRLHNNNDMTGARHIILMLRYNWMRWKAYMMNNNIGLLHSYPQHQRIIGEIDANLIRLDQLLPNEDHDIEEIDID